MLLHLGVTKQCQAYFIEMRSENVIYLSILSRFASTDGRCPKTVRKFLEVRVNDGLWNIMGAFVKSVVV